MVKDVKNLDAAETFEFKELYNKYIVSLIKNTMPETPKKLRDFISNRKGKNYVDRTAKRLKSGEMLGYVFIGEDTYDYPSDVRAFIVGRTYYDNVAWISHFFVDTSEDISRTLRKSIALELCKSIIERFKREGMLSVSTEISVSDDFTKEILTSIGFDKSQEYQNGSVGYERKL